MKPKVVTIGSRTVWVLITQCAWCRGIKVWKWYIRSPKPPLMLWQEKVSLPGLPSVVVSMTHGACPACAERVNESARKARLRQSA